jgi:hypothetical protein
MKVIQNSPDGDSLPLYLPPLRESKTSMIRNGSPDEEKLIGNQNSSPRGQHSELFSNFGSASKANATSGHRINTYVKSNHESDSKDGSGTGYDGSTGSDRTDDENEATIIALFPKLPTELVTRSGRTLATSPKAISLWPCLLGTCVHIGGPTI